jgi:hypothetical protein
MRSVVSEIESVGPSSSFFAKIGRKGGLAGKGSPAKRKSAIAAAKARWGTHKARSVVLTVEGDDVYISRDVPGMEKALSSYTRKRGEKGLIAERVSYLFSDGGRLFTPVTLLSRLQKFLQEQKVPYKIKWVTPPAYKRLRADLHIDLGDWSYRERRALARLLKQPAGGLCDAKPEDRERIMTAVLTAFHGARTIIVVEETERLFELHRELQHLLREPIGILSDGVQEGLLSQERITLMTPAYIKSGIIPQEECEILIFDRCPRSVFTRVQKARWVFPKAWRLAFLGKEKRGDGRMFLAEVEFGPLVEFR